MNHVQHLESRMLMSATAAMLNADYAAIVAARAPIAAALTPAATQVAVGLKTISADLKGTTDRSQKIANARLVARLRVDQVRLLSALRLDSTILTLRGTALSAQAKAAGLAVLQKATTLRMARVTSTANNLNTVVAAELATLLGDTHLAAFNSDLDALTAANASNTQLASDIAAIKTAVTVQPFDTAAQTFAAATGTLATDLLPPVTPPPPTTVTSTALIVVNFNGNNVGEYDLATGALLGTLPTDGSTHFPIGAAFDSAGNLFVSNGSSDSIVEYASTNGVLSTTGTVFASGSALLASPSGPAGVVFDAAGNLYVADSSGAKIVKFPVVGGVLSSTATTLVANTSGFLSGPFGMTFDNAGHLFAVNRGAFGLEQVEEFDATTGAHLATLGNSHLHEPSGLAFDSNGNLFVSSYVSEPNQGGNDIIEFANTGGTLSGTGTVFANLPTLTDPTGVAPIGLVFDSAGNLYVAESNEHSIVKFAFTGGSLSTTPTVFASGVALQGPSLLTIHTVTTTA
jgi:sugar lactone lactonase YvrE